MRGYQYNDNVSEYIQIKINRKIDRNRPIKYFPELNFRLITIAYIVH